MPPGRGYPDTSPHNTLGPNPNQTGTSSGGRTYGSRFDAVDSGLMSQLSQLLNSIDFGNLGYRTDLIFRNGNPNHIRAGALRRLRTFGGLQSSQRSLIDKVLGALGAGPGFSGQAEDGSYNFASNLASNFKEGDAAQLSSIFDQNRALVSKIFKGGEVNFPEIRRLYRQAQEEKAKEFLRQILIRGRKSGTDDFNG